MVLYRQHRFLLDCGEGTQRQILKSGLGFKRLNKILLTHSHLDHIYGLGGLVSTLGRWESLDAIDIYGGQATLNRVHDILFRVVFPNGRSPIDINLHPIKPGIIFEDNHFALTAFPVTHRGPDCLGYMFEEKAVRPFLAEKASLLGVPFGPERSQLVQGHSIRLADGRYVHPDDVLGPLKPGTKYVHTGDIGRVDEIYEYGRHADALVIEATYTEEEAELAKQFGHMTAAQAARFALDANVKTLILTHLSRRHFEREIREEARAIFPNVYVARDFDHFQISREGTTRLKKSSSKK